MLSPLLTFFNNVVMKKIVFSAILLGFGYTLVFSQTADKLQVKDSVNLFSVNQKMTKEAIKRLYTNHCDSLLSSPSSNTYIPVYDDLNWLILQKRLFACKTPHINVKPTFPHSKSAT